MNFQVLPTESITFSNQSVVNISLPMDNRHPNISIVKFSVDLSNCGRLCPALPLTDMDCGHSLCQLGGIPFCLCDKSTCRGPYTSVAAPMGPGRLRRPLISYLWSLEIAGRYDHALVVVSIFLCSTCVESTEDKLLPIHGPHLNPAVQLTLDLFDLL